MFLATAAAYRAALLDPSRSLRNTGDPNLMGGRLVYGPIGPPRPDQVAVVFEFEGANGDRYALRCFLSGTADALNLPARWEAVGQVFGRPENGLTGCTAPFTVMSNGITVRTAGGSEADCPLVVMEWITGQPLTTYLARKLGNASLSAAGKQQIVHALIDQLLAILERLHEQGVALGDWASSNTIVTPDGRLVAIDYDTTFIREFRGLQGLVGGQDGYRHPGWDDDWAAGRIRFDERGDWFAGQVILTALLALRAAPLELLPRLRAEPLAVLFTEADLRRPDEAPLFAKLLTAQDRLVQRAALLLKDACRRPRSELEPPHTLLRRLAANPPRQPGFTALIHGDQLVLDWGELGDQLRRQPGIVITWSEDDFPETPFATGTRRRIVASGECSRRLRLPHLMPGARRLYLRLFQLATDSDGGALEPSERPIPGGEAVAEGCCVVTYRLSQRRGSKVNTLIATTLDGSPVPSLTVVGLSGSAPLGVLGGMRLGDLGGQGRSIEELRIDVAARRIPRNTYVRPFLTDAGDYARVSLRPARSGDTRLRLT